MMEFFGGFQQNEYMWFFFCKKNQIWSKNLKISFRQFKLTLAEGGDRSFLKKYQSVYGAIKMWM